MARFLILATSLLSLVANAQSAEQLPAYLLQLPASIGSVFVAETDSSTLYRFVRVPGEPDFHDERYMSVGENGVGKNRAWDRRTPLGIYFISEELDTSRLHEKYGSLAFPLDYPNVWDRLNERSGDGIWIHGVDPKAGRRPPQDTDGCIALPNNELVEIKDDFVPLITPVIITREIRWVSSAEVDALRAELQAALEMWVQSYRAGDMHRYLSMYAHDFRYRGLNRGEWSAYRLQTIGSRSVQDLVLSEVLLLADPEEKGLFLSRFRQTIVDDVQTIVTTKRLYWRRSQSGEFRIVAEDNG
jgi:murein L,D-transpeptidase YafK